MSHNIGYIPPAVDLKADQQLQYQLKRRAEGIQVMADALFVLELNNQLLMKLDFYRSSKLRTFNEKSINQLKAEIGL